MGKGGKQNHLDTEFIGLTPAEVQAIADDPSTTTDRRRRAVRHLKALGYRNRAKRRKGTS